MPRYTYFFPFVAWLLLVYVDASSQASENIILKAMQDELKRSMEIRDTGYDKPFFINYGISDLKNFSVYTTLGAVIQSGESKSRTKSVRVLVGDYEFNDESLDNNTFSGPSSREIQLPAEDDYYGIRRALWTTTDIVYKGAAQKFRKHQNTLKEQQKSLVDIPHRTFAETPAVQSVSISELYAFDKAQLEDYCRKLSAVFIEFPALESSDVMMSVTQGNNYIVSSEGSVIAKPYAFAVLQCRAQAKTDKGEPVADAFVHYARSPKEFPTTEEILKEAKALANQLTALQRAETLEEEYTGPVLFLGPAVADVFSSALFSYKETLIASNTIATAGDFRPEATTMLDVRIGKSIMDNAFTVKAKSRLKKFGETILLGGCEIDDEGVAPPAEVLLIENGVLRSQLNDRSLTKPGQVSNGHATGPAVIEITSMKASSEKELKTRLIAAAREQALSFALMIRDVGNMGDNMSEVWKVNLDTGAESLLRSSQLNGITLKDMRKIAGASKNLQAVSVEVGEGSLASFICPDALLLDHIEVVPMRLPYTEDDAMYVPSPLNNDL